MTPERPGPRRPPGPLARAIRRSAQAAAAGLAVVAAAVVPKAAADDPTADQPPVPEVTVQLTVRPDPAWWSRALAERLATDFAPVPRDTAGLLDVGARGWPATLDLILARPDSATERRLWELDREDDHDLPPALADLLRAAARGRAMADLRSREAAMFDEFLLETVVVPDPE